MIRAASDRYPVRGWSAHGWRDTTGSLLAAGQEHQAGKRLAGGCASQVVYASHLVPRLAGSAHYAT
jgi:hypothetical protein